MMRTSRQIVLPALRLLVWAVIAAALVVLAFRNGADPDASARGAAVPAPAQLDSPTIAVTAGDVVNTVTVQGAVAADPAVPVRATAAGTVRRLLVAAGAPVTKDQPLLEITVEVPTDPAVTSDPPAPRW